MNATIHDILYKYWGYRQFREKQEEIITSVLEGNDTLGLLPTGGGKSITFQVPAMLFDGIAIVITPLISLMKDQVDNLRQRHIKALYIHSGLRYTEIRNAIDKCIYGDYKFLYISPERLSSASFMDSLRLMKVSFLVVDEAHCISQWGYAFRPSYLKISSIRKIFPNIPVLALTASATKEVITDIIDKLEFRGNTVIRKSFRRENLSYIVRRTENKQERLINIIKKTTGSCIVYVRSRKKTKLIAEDLSIHGISADYYHAGLSNEEKQDKQDKWKNGTTQVIVATNAFGMGIDKPDVRVVTHLDVPNSIEEYYQEAGRAGRDSKRAYAVMLASPRDKSILLKRISEAFPPKDTIKEIYVRLCNFLEISLGGGFDKLYEFNFNLFCTTFKYPASIASNALKILTQTQYIEYIEEVDTLSKILILANKRDLYDIKGITPRSDEILELILRNYTGLYADYVTIDELSIAYKFNIPLQDIYDTLIFLNKQHVIHYIPRRRTAYIYFPCSRVEPRHLEITKEVYEKGKERLEKRINSIIAYAENDSTCREKMILEYFGEKANDCNRCDICIEHKKKKNDNIQEIQEGILYMLSLKPRKMIEFIDTLSFNNDAIINQLRFLCDEGKILYADDIFTLK